MDTPVQDVDFVRLDNLTSNDLKEDEYYYTIFHVTETPTEENAKDLYGLCVYHDGEFMNVDGDYFDLTDITAIAPVPRPDPQQVYRTAYKAFRKSERD